MLNIFLPPSPFPHFLSLPPSLPLSLPLPPSLSPSLPPSLPLSLPLPPSLPPSPSLHPSLPPSLPPSLSLSSPQAFGLHDHGHDDGHAHSEEEEGEGLEVIWKACIIILGTYGFFLFEFMLHSWTSHSHSIPDSNASSSEVSVNTLLYNNICTCLVVPIQL